MKIELYRNYYRSDYIIGKLFIDDFYFCDTLEPCYKNQHGCIPAGTYRIALDVVSPKFKERFPYKTLCHGMLPRLLNVPSRSGILIHCGNLPSDTQGCILLGKNTKVGQVTSSINTFTRFYNKIKNNSYLLISVCDVPIDKQSFQYVPSFLNHVFISETD